MPGTGSSTNRKKYLIALTLIVALSAISGKSQPRVSGVEVELSTQTPLTLHVTVHSHAHNRITLYSFMLPWGNRNAMMLVPVTHDRECFDNKYLMPEEPSYQKLSIEPNGSLSGDVDLRKVLPGLENALKKSDVHLLWAYRAPEELRIGDWSGGWIFIPQHR